MLLSMMKKMAAGSLLAGWLACASSMAAPSAPVNQKPSLIPYPAGVCAISSGAPGLAMERPVEVGKKLADTPLGLAARQALQAAGIPTQVVRGKGVLDVVLIPHENKEYYQLEVSPQALIIRVADKAGLFCAAQTVAQSVVRDVSGRLALPAMKIEDQPMLPYRGLLIDTARSPLPVEGIKKILRVMARYKLNRLHWHLVDDQGWRVEIQSYPRLTSVSALRPESPRADFSGEGDGTPERRFYTREQVAEVVAEAHRLGITVIPEIEVPGHSSAALAAYPELGNDDVPGYAPRVSTQWGVQRYIYAPKEECFTFLERVFQEICEMFPRAEIIHIGGDEVPRDHWKQSRAAQEFMREHGMQHEGQIQSYFTARVARMLARQQRRIMGWDEILEDGQVDSSAVVMVWRDLSLATEAVKRGHDVVLCPTSHCYLDYSQGKDPLDPTYRGLGNSTDKNWQHLYTLNPMVPGLSEEEKRHVIGVQGNAWGEAIRSMDKLEYMVVPRLCALAEVAWLPAEKRRAEHFASRLAGQRPYFEQEQLNYREEDGTPHRDPDAMGR